MRIGCCASINEATSLKDAGFDYIEINAKQVLRAEEPDHIWNLDAPDVDKMPLPIEAANSLLPTNLAVVGQYRDMQLLEQYMQRAVRRAAQLGVKRLVFGSGVSRRRPEDVNTQTSEQQLIEFCRLAGDICAEHDIIFAIEHLNHRETNMLNRLQSVDALINHLAHPRVAAAVDSYHFGIENESDNALLKLGSRIQHVHLAEPVERREPGAHGQHARHAFDFQHFFALLHQVGYTGRFSVEARFSGPLAQVGPCTIELLKNAWRLAANT